MTDDLFDQTRLIATLKATTNAHVLAVAEVLVAHGVTAFEFSLTMPGALAAISTARRLFGSKVAVGAGSVFAVANAKMAMDAGAQFIASPSVCSDVMEYVSQQGLPALPSAMTPTEIIQCVKDGAYMVRIFPSTNLGPGYFREVSTHFPWVPLVAAGDIGADHASEYLAAGASALAVEDTLVNRTFETGDLHELRQSIAIWSLGGLVGIQDGILLNM